MVNQVQKGGRARKDGFAIGVVASGVIRKTLIAEFVRGAYKPEDHRFKCCS